MRRKDFLKIGGMLAATASQTRLYGSPISKASPTHGPVDFVHDGLLLSPKEYAALLMKLADEGKIKTDYYSNGGVVEELEAKFVSLLGKESAVFMPTGTLANHIAVRHLAGQNRRVIVQEQSHLYNDTGDCAQTLSGLTLIPLGVNSVEFSLDELDSVVKKTQGGRVETHIGAISIESPVRRQKDQLFRYESVQKIAEYARSKDIKMHLDGARLFVQPVHNNVSVVQYSAPFDTVYTSLWKCFNAASGAVLAGTKSFTTNLFHERRMFGSGLPAAWAFAAVALYYADSFAKDYKQAWTNAQQLFGLLQKDERFSVTQFENGSHIVELTLKNANPTRFREALAKSNIELSAPTKASFLLKVNPSLNRIAPQSLASHFIESLS
ncbi:amino acid lyase [Spirosoma sp. HMF4905]|uniref:Amino acid lyase n=1 Tax=Spirosoma arboris TaxID=2682092 RepID=A0A7K1SHD5_9BACT|nr:beta-eliminating lyase-related protein [Spirosoma arboris]MVM33219.1 amino acid lyase [Spirosoma arboris]